MNFVRLLFALIGVVSGFYMGSSYMGTVEGAIAGAVIGLILVFMILNFKTFVKGAIGLGLVVLIAYLVLSSQQPKSSGQSNAVAYTLSSGQYLFTGPFIPEGTDIAESQSIVVDVTNEDGEVNVIAAGETLVGTLDGNAFRGSIDGVRGRLEVTGNLTDNDRLSGMIFDDDGESIIGPYVLFRN